MSDQEATRNLLREIEELRRREAELKALEAEHGHTVWELRERVKELNCLYAISRLAQQNAMPLEELFQKVVELLPQSWQYPEVASACIEFGGRRYKTSRHRRTAWRQTCRLAVRGERVGRIEICYIEARPDCDKGPFLKEERHLLDAVAEHLGRIVEARQAEEHMRVLARELIRAQESERQRIARELHDNVAQELSMLKVATGTLLSSQPSLPSDIRQPLTNLSVRLGAAVSAVRDLSYDLLPPGLDQLGLVSTAFRLCEDCSARYDMNVEFFADGLDGLKLEFETQINLYRIVQEALANVRKHARAGKTVVRLVASHPSLLLLIEDDGRGFEAETRAAEALGEKRMGLWSMRERVRLLDGTVAIRSKPGCGTRIHVEVPLKRLDAHA